MTDDHQTMSDMQVICLKCTVCSCLFTTEIQFYKHARHEHCEEVVLLQQQVENSFSDLQSSIVAPADIDKTENTMKVEQNALADKEKRTCTEKKLGVTCEHDQINKESKLKPENISNKTDEMAHNDETIISFVVLNKNSNDDDQPVLKVSNTEKYLSSVGLAGIAFTDPTDAVSALLNRHLPTELHTKEGVKAEKKASARSHSNRAWRDYKRRNAGSEVCTLCGKTFSKLYLHYKHYHAPARHVCETCKKVFKAKCDLIVHRRIHTGERPYSCDVCGRRFAQSGQVKTHRATHFNNGGFVCHQCGKVLRSPATLASHGRGETFRLHSMWDDVCQACLSSHTQ